MDNYGDYDAMGGGLFAGIGVGAMIFYLAIIVLYIAGFWKMFEKAGKPGWAAIVPVYNMIIIAEIVGKPIWWGIVAALVPCVNIVFSIWLLNLLMKSFGKEVPLWTVLTVFFGFVTIPVIGFGDAKYVGPTAAEATGGDSFSNLRNDFDNLKDSFDDKDKPQNPPL
ncbi:hypothetical protein GCM10007415_07120 [Parapedobacter pyrenivorans]|uniref:Signal peptidase I n=1 Tax=Parapedobacter pyrenivorans TaxID=1305674 RepID=A0A917HFV7_9SPHI|nr:DUF5684 domain-containing protein [Parapedobacter pyrenivorans]GGG77712.1 hypothetical protein GCM10007415_07120 [Parapedobacter pyrenivorans]